jgi:hypothetical protein
VFGGLFGEWDSALLIMFCIDSTCFVRIFICNDWNEMHVCHFLNTVLLLNFKFTKQITNWMNILMPNTATCFLVVQWEFICRVYRVNFVSARKGKPEFPTQNELLLVYTAVIS